MILKSLLSFTISMILMPQVHGGGEQLVMSKKIAKEQRRTLMRDLEYIQEMPFSQSADPRTLEILEINDLNATTAHNWLLDRVSAVIEDVDTDHLKLTAQAFARYPVTDEASIEKALPAPADGSGGRGVTVMSNIGTGLYYAGKTSSQLFSLKIKTGFLSSKIFTITSPRTGIIQIGEGLFMKKYLMNKKNEAAKANSLGRMAVFFHEARHSDGSGSALGFFHAVCPSGHDFAGAHACDRNLNGPYSVGTQMLKEFIKNCDECSVSEKEQMRLRYLDSANRILLNTPVIADTDDREVSSLKVQLETQKMIYTIEGISGKRTRETYNKIIDLEKRLMTAAKEADAIKLIPSVDWDASAESIRL